MGRDDRHSAVLTVTSMSACATSSPDGTKWWGAAHADSPVTSSMENADCCTLNGAANDLSVCLAVSPVGEPDAGNRLVRFDERGERSVVAWPKQPRLSSTLPKRPIPNDRSSVAIGGKADLRRAVAKRREWTQTDIRCGTLIQPVSKSHSDFRLSFEQSDQQPGLWFLC